MCIAGGVYVAGFAEAHRVELGVLVALTGFLGAATLWLVPWQRIVASRWREATELLSWRESPSPS